MELHKISLLCSTLTVLIFAISIPRLHVVESAGFTIDLIHRDHSLQSALQRSFNRARTLVQDASKQSASTDIVPDRGEYLMRFSIGTPQVETLAIADTGSDLTWIQCKPCNQCFDQQAPFFDPNHSSTYKSASCKSTTCNALSGTSCDSSKNTCRYSLTYGDRSFSRGDVATETIALGSTTGKNVSIPNVIIGCGHSAQGTFGAGSSGIVGLGGGDVSLIRQMGPSIQGKFSYCLVPYFSSLHPRPSKMNFGDQAVVSGGGAVATPIVAKTPSTFYFLTLEGMTVGTQRFNSVAGVDEVDDDLAMSEEGNIIIDSGTTLTFLPGGLYEQVETAVKKQMKLRETRDPEGLLKLCYISTGDDVMIPEITAHFKGADVKLKPVNTFIRTSPDSLCLAFVPATSFAIYGNVAQMDFLVGYDLEKKTVSFKPTDCDKA